MKNKDQIKELEKLCDGIQSLLKESKIPDAFKSGIMMSYTLEIMMRNGIPLNDILEITKDSYKDLQNAR